MKMEEHYKKAIEYVRDNHEWSEACEEYAWECIDKMRCPITMVSDEISNEIRELMDEYGQNNDLPEDWWMELGDEDDVFSNLYN